MHDVFVVAAAFAASAVEMVEALTIVLAVGVTARLAVGGLGRGGRGRGVGRDRRRARAGPRDNSDRRAPCRRRRALAGVRAPVAAQGDPAGRRLQGEARRGSHLRRRGRAASGQWSCVRAHDWYAFTVAFKGVFLEGLEVAFIVVTIGGTQGNVGLAAIGAAAALLAVLAAGLVVHEPLSRVPENSLKFGVGVMLTSFGIFWSAEGVGVTWPGADASLLGVIVFVAAVAVVFVEVLRVRSAAGETAS